MKEMLTKLQNVLLRCCLQASIFDIIRKYLITIDFNANKSFQKLLRSTLQEFNRKILVK